jgi:hypothetical protein
MPSFSAISSTTDSGEGGVSGAGRAIGGGARVVDHHIETVDHNVGNVVGSENAHRARAHHGARVRTCLVRQKGLSGGNAAVLARADFHFYVRARRRPSAFENILAGHHDLYRLAGFLRK